MEPGEFTQVLARFREGDDAARQRLIGMIHDDLRQIARRHLSGNRWIATLNTTALVNESYLRLVSPAAEHVATRPHFLNLAALAMRQIVCDYARKRLREPIERAVQVDDRSEEQGALMLQAEQFVALDEALNDLARVNARQARLVECRFFAGLSEEETAAALDVSLRTVQREWQQARQWLADALKAR
jgi:RNA polymerase sigma factor (TIGR02999 family)